MFRVTVTLGWRRRREGKNKNENEKELGRRGKTAACSIPMFVLLVLQGVSGKVLEGQQRGVMVRVVGGLSGIFEWSDGTAMRAYPSPGTRMPRRVGEGGFTALPTRIWYLSSTGPSGCMLMYLPGMCKRLAGGDGWGSDAWRVGPRPAQ